MQAVILAAGEGKRMRPLTLELPKPLVRVAGKPIIEHILDALPAEIDGIIIVVGYKAQMIRDRLGTTYHGRSIRYVDQWMPAGTAHALGLARPFLKDRFLLLNADDLHGRVGFERALAHPLSLLVARHDEPQRMGVVSARADGSLEAIVEKPEHPVGNLVSTGAMVLDTRIFDYEAPRDEQSGEYYITHPLEQFAQAHPIQVVEQTLWLPIGYPDDIAKAEARLATEGVE